jgi:tripartite-type tricarboxylate transporter receptor subunit TctC
MKAAACGCLVVLAVAAVGSAHAQYPAKPVRWILPFPPGGGSDALARIMSPKFAEVLGQQIIIDNRPGAGANIGAEVASKAPPDGYTILMGNVAHAINVTLYAKPGYDLVKDFAAVNLLASTPNIVVVHPSVPVRSIHDLIALAKSRPGELDLASSGSGSSAHLAGELFNNMTGTRMNHVPYKGGGPAVAALIGGEVSIGFATTPSVIGHVKSGKLRGLAVTTSKRSAATPELPTVSEAGVKGYEAGTWYGLLVPTGTAKETISRLHAESMKVLAAPDVKPRLDAAGFEAIGSTPDQFGTYIRSEVVKWGKVVRAAQVRID